MIRRQPISQIRPRRILNNKRFAKLYFKNYVSHTYSAIKGKDKKRRRNKRKNKRSYDSSSTESSTITSTSSSSEEEQVNLCLMRREEKVTPSECHCYVCDCSAPCVYWARHCSSTHKEQAWRVERQYLRRIKREQHSTQQPCDVKLAFAIPNRQPVSKVAQCLQLPNDESRLTHHQDPLQQIQSTILRESPHPWTDNAAPNQQVSKAAPSVPALCDESKSAHHRDHEQQIQRTIPREQPRTSTETTAPKRRPISKAVPSLSPSGNPKSLHKDPVQQHTQRTIPTEPPRSCIETLTTRPKDILCEIYKICPTVISCRRRIPPLRHSDELSDNDQGD